jgi:hypothetical protein
MYTLASADHRPLLPRRLPAIVLQAADSHMGMQAGDHCVPWVHPQTAAPHAGSCEGPVAWPAQHSTAQHSTAQHAAVPVSCGGAPAAVCGTCSRAAAVMRGPAHALQAIDVTTQHMVQPCWGAMGMHSSSWLGSTDVSTIRTWSGFWAASAAFCSPKQADRAVNEFGRPPCRP